MPARSISCSAWPAATNIFFGVQPRFGQVPPRSLASITATDIPARRTGPVTPIPALPPPRITTSNCSAVIELASFFRAIGTKVPPCGLTRELRAPLPCGDGRGDRLNDLGRHFELGFAIPDVVAARDPFEIGPDRPDVAIVVLRQEQTDRPVEPGIRVRGDEPRAERGISEDEQGRGTKLDAGIGRELRLIDFHEELDALAR